METCGRKEVVMKNLSNYLRCNIDNYLYGFLKDMVYVHPYRVDSHWRKKSRK